MEKKYHELLEKYKKRIFTNNNVVALIHTGGSYLNDIWEKSDIDLLVILNAKEENNHDDFIEEENGVRIHLRFFSKSFFVNHYLHDHGGSFHNMIDGGNILFDKEHDIFNMINENKNNEKINFKIQVMLEFSHLLEKYYRSQKYLAQEKYQDAYWQLLRSMVHWARIIVYENNCYPRKDIWDQVYNYNVGIYKLFEELTFSEEPLHQRVELMQLVYLNTVIAKAVRYSKPLLDYLQKAGKPVNYRNIMRQDLFFSLGTPMQPLLDELIRLNVVEKQFIGQNNADSSDNIVYSLKNKT